jgi:hypothetical protein
MVIRVEPLGLNIGGFIRRERKTRTYTCAPDMM